MLTLMAVLSIILLYFALKLGLRLAFVTFPAIVEKVAELPWWGQALFLLTIAIILWGV